MIVKCEKCGAMFDDEYRTTTCYHEAFPANDGKNVFTVHHDAYLRPGKRPWRRPFLGTWKAYVFDLLCCLVWGTTVAMVTALLLHAHARIMAGAGGVAAGAGGAFIAWLRPGKRLGL